MFCLTAGCDTSSDTTPGSLDGTGIDAAPSPDAAPQLETSADSDPPWLSDASWDAPTYETAVDDAGCLRLWTHVGLSSERTFGPDGVVIRGAENLSQGWLTGDFTVTLDVEDVESHFPGQGVRLMVEGRAWDHVTFSAEASAELSASNATASVQPAGYSAGKSTSAGTGATAAKLQIERKGASITATSFAADGNTGTVTMPLVTTEPLRLSIGMDTSIKAHLRRFTVVGGGSEVRSDDFACDSIMGE